MKREETRPALTFREWTSARHILRRVAESVHKVIIEWQVRRIPDPVDRLRYLRRAQGLSCPRRLWRLPIWWRHVFGATIMFALLLIPRPTASDQDQPVKPGQIAISVQHVSDVWLVEQKDGVEYYSNGLQIENKFRIAGEKRHFAVYDSDGLQLVQWQDSPVGIIYHTTESHVAPFDEEHNRRLQLVGQWLLEYVRKNACYHFVIDRFGRVHRVVDESSPANHVGYSIWADGRKLYVNLNPSFLGVAFETRTDGGGPQVTSAQVYAARVLTQMLRTKYRIAATNCITHAQVSVSVPKMRIGNHVDWSSSFPFGAIGLGDNYSIPVPAVSIFGFAFDQTYLKLASPDLWRGVALGEDGFRHRAASRSISITEHREAVQKRYREIIKGLDKDVEATEKTT